MASYGGLIEEKIEPERFYSCMSCALMIPENCKGLLQDHLSNPGHNFYAHSGKFECLRCGFVFETEELSAEDKAIAVPFSDLIAHSAPKISPAAEEKEVLRLVVEIEKEGFN